jgi:hypothetical protein
MLQIICFVVRSIYYKVKVCFITAYEESISEFRGLFSSLEEVDSFIRKPIEIQKLVEIVKSKLNYK